MAIKWSALAVSEATDKVEQQVVLTEDFIAEAKTLTEEAFSIPNLPEYIKQHLRNLQGRLEGIDAISASIKSIRQNIPAKEIERESKQHLLGKQQRLT